MKGSYQLDSFTSNKEAEVTRLKAQVELFFEKEFEAFKKFGLKDGMKIIECGSGPGYLILNILKQFPNCDATALEIDPYLFEVLTKNSESEGKKLYKPIQGSIYDIAMPDESVDFAVTRLVIEHLEDPMKALLELRRILKPGGILVVVSNDFAYHVLTYPVIPELDEMFDAYNRSRFSEGGNPLIGRQMPVFLDYAGFRNIDIQMTTAHSKLKGDQAMLNAENVNISRSLVKEGFLKPETLENLLRKWFEMLQNPDHVIFRQLFIIGGKKDPKATIKNPAGRESDKKSEGSDHALNKASNGTGKTDEQLLDIWRELLKNNNISTSDNFFEVGGHSVIIPEILNLLKERHGKSAQIIDFFQHPTVKTLAEHIDTGSTSTAAAAKKASDTREPASDHRITVNKTSGPATTSMATSPETEENILNVWKEILKNDQVVPTDNFFEIGGNSVLIPEILKQLEDRFGINLKIMDFFQAPTVKLQAEKAAMNAGSSGEEVATSENDLREKVPEYTKDYSASPGPVSVEGNPLAKMKAQRNRFKDRRRK